MKNKRRSKIIIEMNHIDNASNLFQFLHRALKVGDMGGDLYMEYDGAEKKKVCIGHDVKAVNIYHTQKIEDDPKSCRLVRKNSPS